MPEVRTKSRANRRARERSREPEKKPASRWWIYAAAAAVALYLVFQVYSPALSGPYIFDDISQPYQRPNYPNDLGQWLRGVRPLLMLSYWVNYQFSQETPIFHVTNVLIHIFNSLLVFFIVRKLLPRDSEPGPFSDLLPAFAAAVFLLHPIQTEAVSYVAGRSESLSVLLFLAAFTVFLYRRSASVSWRVAIAVLLLSAVAVATKEHTLVLPALLLLTDYYWNPGFSLSGIRKNWRLYVPIALGVPVGAALVLAVLRNAGTAGFGMRDFTWYQYFFTQCRAFFVYLRLLVFPAGQNLDWEYPISRSILDHGAFFALLVILALVAAAIYYRRRYPVISYGFLVYLLLMAPTSSFVPIKDPVAERRMYLPMIGILLVVTGALRYLRVDRRKLAGALCAIIALLAIVTYQRNQLWASDIALWEDAASKSPGKARVHFQLGHTYYIHQRFRDAVAQYAETAKLEPPKYELLYDWGLALTDAGDSEQGLAKLKEGAALDPTAQILTQIGMAYARQKRWPEALEALAQAEKTDTLYDMIYDNRGGIRANTNDLPGAIADYQHALALNPNNEHAREMLEIVQQHQQRAPR
jgi:tetratricopeptide (TPR) repeat protein